MSISKFNKANLRLLRADMNKALDAVAQKHGITIKAGNARFTENNVTFKIEAGIIGNDGIAKSRERIALEKLYPQYADKVVKLMGKRGAVSGKVVGYNSRAKRYPFQVETQQGQFKVPESSIW